MTLLERRRAMMRSRTEIIWDVICLPENGQEKGRLINHILYVSAGDIVEYEAYCTSDVFNSWHVDERNCGGGVRQFAKDRIVRERFTVQKDGHLMVGGNGPNGGTKDDGYHAYGYYIKARIIR